MMRALRPDIDITCDSSRLVAVAGRRVGTAIREGTDEIGWNIAMEGHFWDMVHLCVAHPEDLRCFAEHFDWDDEVMEAWLALRGEGKTFSRARETTMWGALAELAFGGDADAMWEYIDHNGCWAPEEIFWDQLIGPYRPRERFTALVDWMQEESRSPALDGETLFYSGMACNRDFRAALAAGVNIGVSLGMRQASPLLTKNILQGVEAGVRVFVDTGIFTYVGKLLPSVESAPHRADSCRQWDLGF